MRVLYKAHPLADAEVTIFTENGWKKKIRTDSKGIFSVTPLESEQSRETYLYIVAHKDQQTDEYHCASLLMNVQKPQAEWKSKGKGFDLFTILGMGLVIIVVTLLIYHKRKLDKKTMVKFDEYKVKRD